MDSFFQDLKHSIRMFGQSKVFTATAVVLQPITGGALAVLAGYPILRGWIGLSLVLYVITGAFFSDLPKSVPIPIGENQATFKATVAAGASGTALVTASCNGGSATGACAT